MRAYSAASEEDLRTRDLLNDWAGEGFITETQHRLMDQETACELRRTNIFLRIVLFLFTLIIAGAGVALFFQIFLSRPEPQTMGILFLFFAAISYAGAEFAVSRGRLYRYGIEEALAACSVGFLREGMQLALFSGRQFSPSPYGMGFLVPATGVLASLWIWRRIGLPYAFLAAMVFALSLPVYWTSSHSVQRLIVAALYVAGLIIVTAVRSRHTFTYLDKEYSIAEALLWLGIYLAINLEFSPANPATRWMAVPPSTTGFPKTFYWATWVLIWCLPAAVITRGLHRKDRFVIDAGAIIAILTLITNKAYLGWQWHTWDPMLMGALFIGAALFFRRWLTGGPDEIRHGFTARRLSGKDKHWMNAGAVAFGLVAPHSITVPESAAGPDIQFGGGDSAGGGATSDF